MWLTGTVVYWFIEKGVMRDFELGLGSRDAEFEGNEGRLRDLLFGVKGVALVTGVVVVTSVACGSAIICKTWRYAA